MGRMSNLICLKHVKINNQQRNIILETDAVGRDEMNISPACVICWISCQNVKLGHFLVQLEMWWEGGNGGGPEAERSSSQEERAPERQEETI